MPDSAKDLGIGAVSSVWVIGTDVQPGGFGIYKWNASGWIKVLGGGTNITVDNKGNPWIVNSNGNIYHK